MPTYPLLLTTPYRADNTLRGRTLPNGYCVRGQDPDIAIPVAYRVPAGQPAYILRWHHASRQWRATEELDPYEFAPPINPDPPRRPQEGTYQWVNQRALNMFEVGESSLSVNRSSVVLTIACR